MKTERIEVGGMSCEHCVARVKQALSQLPEVEVESIRIGEAIVSIPSEGVERARVAAAIREAGYTAE